ncbi:hypothetical protein OHC33_007216 [Knufia fluminis]|uniref:Class II aldolase/adducin N-terminal domain-containing protein n=1 Tax=Knufia fluminis TaxID=191047 RepID=A0AAN8EHX2_9EURO|nr:hypothetical protein OHC33_007216 [Knufia fluminis]
MANLTTLLTTLISANHILHYHSIVDAYGHVSVRHPDDASHFIMSGNRAPALVSSPDDFVTYQVSNASAVEPDAPKGYIERYIHSEIYKRFVDVNCVVHAHAPDVLPYATSGVPLRPVFHLPGFLGTEVPVWDIETIYNETDKHDMLVRNERQGGSLAGMFVAPENQTAEPATSAPDRRVVLMRKHGFTTWGPDIETAVFRAVFTATNARVQTDSALLRNAFGGMSGSGMSMDAWEDADGQDALYNNDFEPLTAEQAAAAQSSNDGTIDRPWGLWVAEVEANPLYKNNG